VDEVFSIAYSADFEKAKNIISDICENHPLVLKDPAPFIRMSEHAASSINVTMRVWTKNADYWTVKFDILEAVKAKFDAEGIEIPFNQMDVHIKND
jgi:small conductance mechanosensitive channel